MGGMPLNEPIVGMAVTPDGAGYWLVAADGGIFAFGDAPFFGSMGGQALEQADCRHRGDAQRRRLLRGGLGRRHLHLPDPGGPPFQGSTGSIQLNKPVVGMSLNVAGQYYLVASDGGIFAFPTAGGAPFFGSTGSIELAEPVVGMAAVSGGYYLTASDGGIFAFPTADGPPFLGSTGGKRLAQPVVAMSN